MANQIGCTAGEVRHSWVHCALQKPWIMPIENAHRNMKYFAEDLQEVLA